MYAIEVNKVVKKYKNGITIKTWNSYKAGRFLAAKSWEATYSRWAENGGGVYGF